MLLHIIDWIIAGPIALAVYAVGHWVADVW